MTKCRGYKACSEALKKILEASQKKLKNTTQKKLAQVVREISDDLVNFTASSEPKDFGDWNEVEQIEKLDALADATRQSITANAIADSVKPIMDATSQLNQLAKKLKSETAKNKQKAKEIRLKPVVAAVDSLRAIIEKLKEAKNSLSAEDNEVDVAKQIDNLMKAFHGLDKAMKAL